MEQSQYKEFNQLLYDNNNSIAIITALNYLLSRNVFYYDVHPLEQKEKFKHSDFYLIKIEDNRKVYFEVERKEVWTKDYEWQGYETLDIPIRKKYSKADVFIMLNNNANTLAVMYMRDVLSSKTYSKRTKYTEKEDFFAVSLEKVKFFKTKWEMIN